MAIQDLLTHLKYRDCNCQIQLDKNGVKGNCSKHPNSVLLLKGARVGVVLREIERRKFDKYNSKIV